MPPFECEPNAVLFRIGFILRPEEWSGCANGNSETDLFPSLTVTVDWA